MPFESKLRMEYIEGTKTYKLTSPLIYRTWKNVIRIIPTGFVFDGHSIPMLLRGIAGSPFASTTVKASCYHDWLCRFWVAQGRMPRAEGDSEYSHALADEGWKGGPWKAFKRKRNYIAVRIGAGMAWISGLFKRRKKKPKK